MQRARPHKFQSSGSTVYSLYCDRDEVNPGRSRFGHGIIYNRCLHETRMKNAQTGLKSSHRTGTNPERDECEQKYISDRSQLRSLLQNNACSTKRCKKTMVGRDFRTGLIISMGLM